jgi:hypothetical protein
MPSPSSLQTIPLALDGPRGRLRVRRRRRRRSGGWRQQARVDAPRPAVERHAREQLDAVGADVRVGSARRVAGRVGGTPDGHAVAPGDADGHRPGAGSACAPRGDARPEASASAPRLTLHDDLHAGAAGLAAIAAAVGVGVAPDAPGERRDGRSARIYGGREHDCRERDEEGDAAAATHGATAP